MAVERAPLRAPSLDEVMRARERIAGIAIRTPLLRAPRDVSETVWLKMENLQPIGSFKIRGAANAMALAGASAISRGVYTASAGNMAQGVAWCAREAGVPCSVVVPDHAPLAKTSAIERLGGVVKKVPFDVWWQTLVDHHYPGMDGLFIHPFADTGVMAGNGTIALEVLEDLPEADVILVPYGGGGLACGIASVVRELRPSCKVYAVEAETAAPLTASLRAGAPLKVETTRTFIDGMGSNSISTEMWPLVRELLAGTVVVSVAQVESAVRTLATRMRVVAEGAGASALAAAVDGSLAGRRVAGIVSGGNIDGSLLARLLADHERH